MSDLPIGQHARIPALEAVMDDLAVEISHKMKHQGLRLCDLQHSHGYSRRRLVDISKYLRGAPDILGFDMPSPFKKVLDGAMKGFERTLDDVVYERVGVVKGLLRHGVVKAVDMDAVRTEGLIFGMEAMRPEQRRWIPPNYVPPADMVAAILAEIRRGDDDDMVEARLLDKIVDYGGRL